MAGKRYITDYRLNEYFGEDGRVRRSYEYIGDDYCYVHTEQEVRRALNRGLLCCLLGWCGLLAAFLFPTALSRTVPVALPLVISAVPLFILTDVTGSARLYRQPMERRQAERISGVFPPAALFTGVFSGASVFMGLLRLMRGAAPEPQREALFVVAAGAVCCAGFKAFRMRRFFLTRIVKGGC